MSCHVRTWTGYLRPRQVRYGQIKVCLGQVKVILGQGRSGQVRTTSGQIRSDVAGTVRNNFVIGQVMTMSEHICSGQIRSGEDSDKSRRLCQYRSCPIRTCHAKIKSGQVTSGQSRSGHEKVD